MSGYINSLRKAVGKAVGKLGKSADEAPASKGEAPDAEDAAPQFPLKDNNMYHDRSSFNIPRTEKFVEGMQQEPHPDLMTMGRPDDGNLNLRLLQDDPKIKQAAELLNIGQDRFKNTSLRKRQTNAQSLAKSESVRKLAKALNKGPDPSYTPTEALALGRFNQEVTERLTEHTKRFIEKINKGTIAQDELLALSHMEDIAIAAQKKWADSGAVAGRTLQVRQALKNNTPNPMYQNAAKEVMDIKGGRLVLQERMKLYAEGKTIEDVMHSISISKWDKTWKEIFFWRYNSMLSSVRTAIANVSGSLAAQLNESLVIKPLTVAFNKVEQRVRWMDGGKASQLSPDAAMRWREAAIDWEATDVGLGLGFRAARDILKGEKIKDGKFFNEIGTRYSVDDIPQGPGIYNAAKRKAALVTRSLEAQDAVFRGMAYQQELSRLAWRRAANSSTDPKVVNKTFDDLRRFTPPDMSKAAREFSQYAVFANDPNMYSNLFGSITKNMSSFQKDNKLVQILVPFVNVVGNLAIYGKNHVLGPLSSKLWTDIFGKNPVRRAEALARFTESAGIGIALHSLWEGGKITGMGHPDRDARSSAARAGYPPNSIKIDGDWHNISRMDPAGMIIALWATVYENVEANDSDPMSAAVETALSIGQLLQDRAMLASVGDAFAVVSGNGSAGMKADLMASLITGGIVAISQPGVMRDARIMHDPVQRQMEAEDTSMGWARRGKMRFQNAWPTLSDDLPPTRDWRGEIVVNQSSALIRGTMPITRRTPMKDVGTLALLNFNVDIRKPDKTLSLVAAGIKLNLLGMDEGRGWAYNKYAEIVGKEQSKMVDGLVRDSFKRDWKKAIIDGNIADGVLYEFMQESLSRALAKGKQLGKMKFLEWLNGRESIPGKVVDEATNEREKIPVPEIFSWSNYAKVDRALLAGDSTAIDSGIYTKPGSAVMPAVRESVEF